MNTRVQATNHLLGIATICVRLFLLTDCAPRAIAAEGDGSPPLTAGAASQETRKPDTVRGYVTSAGESFITSGGPSEAEVQRGLASRIEQQSAGNIKLVGFKHTATKNPDWALEGKTICAAEFEAQIEFSAPCRWIPRFGGRPLTFNTLKLREQNPRVGGMPGDALDISEKGERYTVRGAVLFELVERGWTPAGFSSSGTPARTTDVMVAGCINNLKRIGLGLKLWAGDNADRYPFNVSTNSGGSLELCARGNDGFDANTALHFRPLSNELGMATLLVCPADSSKKPASDFQHLQPSNVSYQLRTGANVDETNPQEILARCPIHGHLLRADGSVEARKE